MKGSQCHKQVSICKITGFFTVIHMQSSHFFFSVVMPHDGRKGFWHFRGTYHLHL